MRRAKKDSKREHRIAMEIIVDARPEERAMGWYYYLQPVPTAVTTGRS
jgi:hypothetical protein